MKFDDYAYRYIQKNGTVYCLYIDYLHCINKKDIVKIIGHDIIIKDKRSKVLDVMVSAPTVADECNYYITVLTNEECVLDYSV